MITVNLRRFAGAILSGAVVLAVPTSAIAAVHPSTPAARPAASLSSSASSSFATSAFCAVTWGSLGVRDQRQAATVLTDVRSGRHTCFDRLVVDLDGPVTGYSVHYVDRVTSPASGATVALRGGARVEIVVNAATYDRAGHPVYQPTHPRELVDPTGYRTFRQVALAGSFEGQTTIGLGVRGRLPMKVTVLPAADGGTRLVIDVAHHW